MNAAPYERTLRRLSERLRQERFFCIMSWSSPVIATVVNMPARNCFQKYLVSLKSSKNHTLLIPLSVTAEHRPLKSSPSPLPT